MASGILFAAGLCLLGAGTARAEGGFRCGNGQVIRHGQTEDDVGAKCGPPDATRSWTEMRRETVWRDGRAVQQDRPVHYDEWTYDLGADRLVRYVTFEDGHLARVRTGSYGKKTPR